MIDILMATYNGERYLEEQIEAIFSQTVANLRLIIRDDCSTDNTLNILEKYEKKYPERIILSKATKNSGSAKDNFFKLAGMSDQNYVMFCDQDDIWLPDKVEKTYRKLLEVENSYGDIPILVHTDAVIVDSDMKEKGKLFEKQKLNCKADKINNILVQNIVSGCTMMVNRALLKMFLKSNDMYCIMHDWWMALIACSFGKISFLPEATVMYRQHDDNSVGAKDASSLKYNLKRLSDSCGARAVLADTYKQAESFLKIYSDELGSYKKSIVEKYISIPGMKKWDRIKTIFKYNFLKYGFFRKLGQIIFI